MKHLKALQIVVIVISICLLIASQGESDKGSKRLASRNTYLGKITKLKPKDKEFDIRMFDPEMKKKWGLQLTDAFKAWKIRSESKQTKKVIVAVIDTGIDVNHPDLKDNLWKNKKEIPNNGKDDDNNGFVDDYHGYNFVANNSDLKDNHGHGTHIAGIIGAVNGNGIGAGGIAHNVELMILKYYDPNSAGNNNLSNTIRSIRYAVSMKKLMEANGEDVKMILNYSGGGLEASQQEKAAIEEAREANILVVAAAGNEGTNSDINGYYPADYDIDNIVSVTAINKSKNVLSTSNIGVNSVDIAAPGNDIYSTLPGNSVGTMTGTSQATAFVTGAAAELMSHFEDFTPQEVIAHITRTGDFDDKLNGKTRYKKRLNMYRAFTILDKGVGANGIIARNAANIIFDSLENPESESNNDPTQLASDPNVTELSSLQKSLEQILNKASKEAQKVP